jgi:hypothetical protein
MEITDFECTQKANTIAELLEFLSRRYEIEGAQVNSFWMAHEDRYPCVGLLVRDDLASVDYMPDGSQPGYSSAGTQLGLKKGDTTMFYFQRERQPVLNDSIISIGEAMRIAQEFMLFQGLPKSIKWTKL